LAARQLIFNNALKKKGKKWVIQKTLMMRF
jgi:hypothetical protein